jgi:hypothetical protein
MTTQDIHPVAAVAPSRLHLAAYGLSVVVDSEWAEVIEALRLDFAWFEDSDSVATDPDVRIRIEQGPPEYERYGGATATFVTPRNVVYQERERTLIDYFGKVLAVRNRSGGDLVVQGEDRQLVHEAVYQFLLSRFGAHLDARGMPRIHGLGLVGSQGGVIVMLPSGGGKTTLGIRALKENGVKVLSDDSPLIDRHGVLHPFPIRMGVNETDAATLPAGSVRRIERMEFHPKLALEVSAFSHRIASPVPLRHLVIGRRSLAPRAQLERLPRRRAATTLFREAVVGVGIYQGMEFVLQHGMRDVFGKIDIATMRALRCGTALRRADVWLLTLSRDHDSNWKALRSLLD